ncbi:MAG: response regulator transcription factor [Candidatus Omnitrophica bacterium]|nr:response regulator transcription factor [Candidatus Omnitrophota bacterium]
MVKVFITDDHELVRRFVRESLVEIPGFCVVGEACSGEETMARIQAAQPDVLVTDLSMPGMNGIQVTRQVRKLLPQVSVLVFSVDASYGLAIMALEAGAKGYVTKDAGLDALATAIRELNHDGFYLSPPLSRQKMDEFRARLRPNKKRSSEGQEEALPA